MSKIEEIRDRLTDHYRTVYSAGYDPLMGPVDLLTQYSVGQMAADLDYLLGEVEDMNAG